MEEGRMGKVIDVLIGISLALILLPTAAFAHTADDPFVTDLIAGQHHDVGEVKVWNDGEYLHVKYETTDDWYLVETHLHVATSFEGIPQTKKGNPKPGKFDIKWPHDPPVQNHEYWVKLEWDPGTKLYIAAHAAVVRINGSGERVQEETAWGDGNDFPWKNWATYFTYVVQEHEEPPTPECEYTVTSLDVSYDQDSNTTTFTYRIKSCVPAISHWVLALGDCHTVVSADPEPWEVHDKNPEPTTGLYGIKWDVGFEDNETKEMYVTLEGNVSIGTVEWAIKAGQLIISGTVDGPACP